MKNFYAFILFTFLTACSDIIVPDVYDPVELEDIVEQKEFQNGTYCATVDYYFPVTGFSATYTLNVDIYSNLLTTIHLPRGGGLNDFDFAPPAVKNGMAIFTSAHKIEYRVQILEGQKCTLSADAKTEDDLLLESEMLGYQNPIQI